MEGILTIELSFDDASAQDFRVADLLAKHGLKATFYIPVMWHSYNLLNEREPLPINHLLELAKEFEIGSHTISHPLLTRIPYGAAEYEITNSKIMLEQVLGQPVTKFSYPRGYATDQLRDIVRKRYDHARSTLVGNIDLPLDSAWENTSVHVACPRREYSGQNWYEYGIKLFNRAVGKKKGYFSVWGHSWEIDQHNAWNALERLFETIKNEAKST